MAGEFQKLPRKIYPSVGKLRENVEEKYWKSFEFPTIVKEFSAVNHIEYSTQEPYDCLVTSASKVQIFDCENNIKRTSTRSKENVYGARFRSDGKLFVTGGDSGTVQVVDVSSRSILRHFKGHTKACHVCCFSKEQTKIFSASDDKLVKYWDLPTGKEILSKKIHKDYIRCGHAHPTNHDLFVTGSYDHTVKVWDTRSNTVVMEMEHGAPVECVLLHDNGSVCLSSGNNYIKVWDILGNKGTFYKHFSNHQKTITTMCFHSNCTKLLTGGLDRHVKVYNVTDYSLVANLSYPSPVLAMDISTDGLHMAVGMTNGAISFRHRKNKNIKTESRKRSFTAHPGSYKYRIRNQNTKPDQDDVVIRANHTPSLSKIDRLLQKFRYHDALDEAFENKGTFPTYIISLLIELSRRNALDIALSDRDAKGLEEIMKFLSKHISFPQYSPVLIPVANLILDRYADMIGKSKIFDKALEKLNKELRCALNSQDNTDELIGTIEQIFCMIKPPPSLENNFMQMNGHIEVKKDATSKNSVTSDKSDVENKDSEDDFIDFSITPPNIEKHRIEL